MDFQQLKNIQNRNKTQGSSLNQSKWAFINRIGYKKGSVIVMTAVFLLTGAYLGIKEYRSSKVKLAQQSPQPFGSVLPDWWLDQYFGVSACTHDACAPATDTDGDKLTNAQEYYYHSNPVKADTNDNGKSDGEDVANNIDPSRKGDVTFDELMTDDSILGESLALDSEVKSIVSNSFDINKVNIPLTPDSRLNITVEENKQTYTKYETDTQAIFNMYFPGQSLDDAIDSIASGDKARMSAAGTKAMSAAIDLTQIQVPQSLVTYHKYLISTLQLIYSVIALDDYKDNKDTQGDLWYDKVESLMAVSQKLNFEKTKLGL